ncbi:ATP-binding cassette sub-family C member 4-like [Bacillus rossius redtenbacheri]|uniref:ATP-binding cassette sub-family C member 4-like n=1 Tax=Bacillus rossius redtenbacheri TaxID=93214 RepID=UPI002FDD4E24
MDDTIVSGHLVTLGVVDSMKSRSRAAVKVEVNLGGPALVTCRSSQKWMTWQRRRCGRYRQAASSGLSPLASPAFATLKPLAGTALECEMEQGKNHDVNPKLTANPLSLLVFWWLKDLFWKGTKKDLDYSDLYDTLPVHKSIVLGHKLERVMGPVLLKLLVQHFGPDATSSWGEASRHAAGLVLCGLTAAVLGHHCNCGNLALGMAVRAACCSLVYRKTLHVSKTALGQTTSVQLVEVLSSDLKRFEQSTFFLHYVWIAPVQAAVVAAIAWRSVGASALIGVGAIFLQTVPVQIMISKCTAGLRRKITSQTGERVGLIKDVINGMQSIKILAWETHIEKLIDLARRRETDLMLKASHLRGLAVSFIVLPERVALFLTLGAYVLLGNHDITADKVFSIAAFYHILNRNMAIRFPNAVQIASETMNSIKRIQKYLLEKEFESKATCASRHGTVHGEKADVTLVDATARWTSSAICETIFKISLSVKHGKLCAVIGPPGSGKSSLLQAVLGELPLSSGAAAVGGDISYASQEPWLFVGSVRQNILLGRPYEPRRYKEVVRVCALQRDFELLPDGDKTIIGEKGASLGPGQRARINLARAVYRKSDIYLLDDPLSTIDSHIGQHILEDCIYSYLHKKTRIIVTSQLQCVERADHIVVMNNGQIEIQGTYQELQASKLNFETILTKNEVEVEEHIHDSLTREISYISTQSSAGGDEDEEADVAGGGEASESPFLGDRAAAARAGWLRSGGGAARLAGLALLLLLCQAAASGSDYWVAFWTKQEEVRGLYEEFRPDDANSSLAGGRLEAAGAAPPPDLSRDLANGTGSSFSQPPPGREALLCVFASCVAATALLTAGRSLLLGAACVAAARRLHADLCRALLRAPLGFFRRVPPAFGCE